MPGVQTCALPICGGDPAIAHDLGGDALGQRAERATVEGDGQVGVGVAIDKAGAGDVSGGVDGLFGGGGGEVANGGDATLLDGDVAFVGGLAGAVEELGVADQEIVHGGLASCGGGFH